MGHAQKVRRAQAWTIAVVGLVFAVSTMAGDFGRVGDINGDGFVDFDDIDPFVAVLGGVGAGHCGPLDYWPLDCLGRDFGSLQNHGALYGDATFDDDVPGEVGIGRSCYFDGAGDYVYLGTHLLPEGPFKRFTVEAWFKTDAARLDPSLPLWTMFAFETTDGELDVSIDGETQRLRVIVYTVAEGAQSLWGPVVTDDVWHRVMVRKDRWTVRLFLDEVQVDIVGAASPLRVNGDWHATVGCKYTDDPAHFFAGWIDEVKVYDRPVPYMPPCTGTVAVGNGPSPMAISHGGDRVYVSCHTDHAVYVLDTTTCNVMHVIDVGMRCSGLAVSDDDQRLYVTAYTSDSAPGYLKIYETRAYTPLDAAEVGITPVAVALSEDGRRAFVSNHVSDTLSVVNIDEDDPNGFCTKIAELQVAPPGSKYGGQVIVSPDDGLVYVATGGPAGHVTVVSADTVGDVYVVACTSPSIFMGGNFVLDWLQGRLYTASGSDLLWIDTADLCAGAAWNSAPLCAGAKGVTISRDATRLFVTCENADLVSIVDTTSLDVVTEISVGDNPQSVVCHPGYPDGSLIYTSLALDDAVQVINWRGE